MAAEDIVTTDPMSRLTCANGTITLSTGSFSGKYLYYIEANEDTVISVLSGYDSAGNVANWRTVLNCATMKAGSRHILPDNCYISSGTIDSGSLNAGKIKG